MFVGERERETDHSVTVVVLLRHREIGDGDTDTTQQVDTSGDDHGPAQDHPSVTIATKNTILRRNIT